MSVVLKVGGTLYEGWTALNIQRGIEQISGSFELQVTDRWNTLTGSQSMAIKAGLPCEVIVSGTTVITGYIDTVKRDYEARSHEISVSGRDKAGDLVDCSAIYKSGQWSNKTIDQIARDLVSPFGIQVKVLADVGDPLPVFAIQEGASVFDELERAAKMRALLLLSDGLGNIVLTRAGTQRAPGDLIEGKNILQASSEFSWKDRFSQYVIKGQSHGDDHHHGDAVAHQSSNINDAGINRYRPLVIVADEQGGNSSLLQRAEWERNVRYGRGSRANITVTGWDAGGVLWTPNTITHLTAPYLNADLDMLIVSVTFSLNQQGIITQLELVRPQAFDTIRNVKQTRLEKKIRKHQGDESGITQSDWEWHP